MTYFQNFPLIPYSIENNFDTQLVTNIFKRFTLLQSVKSNASVFFEYKVKESDRPEIISDKIYGSVEFYWIIFLCNDIINPYEWIKTTSELNEYVSKKYDDSNAIHHWETIDNIIVNSDYPGAIAISNFLYEDRINESKRNIKLLDPIYVQQLSDELIEKLSFNDRN